jgi:hypothetical protein
MTSRSGGTNSPREIRGITDRNTKHEQPKEELATKESEAGKCSSYPSSLATESRTIYR